jgi:hypothetical protein
VSVLFAAWANAATRRRWLTGAAPIVRTAVPPKSMRLQWPDGTLVGVFFTAKGDSKSVVAVEHMKLKDKASAAKAKEDWSERFDALGSLLAAPPVARGRR